MFRKALLATAVLAATSGIALANGGTFAPPPPPPHHIGNFYVGVSVSRDRGQWRADEDTVFINPAFSPTTTLLAGTFRDFRGTDFDWSGEGIDGELFAGYGITFVDHYYLALEGFGDVSSNRGTFDKTLIARDFDLNGNLLASGVLSTEGKFKQQWSAGVSVLPGIKITDSTLLYARIGWIISQFKLTGTVNGADFGQVGFFPAGNTILPGFDRHKDLNGVQLGIGAEAMVTQACGLRLEWDWSRFAKFTSDTRELSLSVPGSFINSVAFGRFEVKHPTNDQFKFGVDYHFNMA
jgi:opacity protein-like surface antigen